MENIWRPIKDNFDIQVSWDGSDDTRLKANGDISNQSVYNIMIEAGFTNLPSEWWHYEYGTKFWSYFKGRPALYKGIIDIKLPEQI